MNKIFNGSALLLAVLLLLSCLTPFIPVQLMPFLSFLNLTIPFLFLANLIVALAALLLGKRVLWISLSAALIAYGMFGSFYKFSNGKSSGGQDKITVLSYNVRSFNSFNWIKNPNLDTDILGFVKDQDPDIVCFQEFNRAYDHALVQYPYQYETPTEANRSTQAIYSKYPIIGRGSLNFPETANNAIYADILYKNDTIRIYSAHLQSFQVIPSRRIFRFMIRGSFYEHISHAFVKQQQQAYLLKEHMLATPYKKILCGDLNNNQYSRVYRILKDDMQDSFQFMGTGFGTTYKLKFLPLRIDVILADPDFEIQAHRNFDIRLSDHFPVMASFGLKKE